MFLIETLVYIQLRTRQYIPEYSELQLFSCFSLLNMHVTVRVEFFVVTSMNIRALWDTASCSLVVVDRQSPR
jgi:hypothetical protein